jgi:hypothetical protein
MRATVRYALMTTILLSLAATAHADDARECVEAFDKAQALRKEDKLIESRKTLLTCTRDACPAMVRSDCDDLVQRIERAMPSVVFSATDGSGRDLLDVRVSVDGVVVASNLDGKAVPIDPGPHVFRFERDGTAPIEERILVREGEKSRTVSVRIGSAEPPPVVPPPPPPLATPVAPVPPPVAPSTSQPSALPWVGVGIGAAGLVSIGVGAGFTAIASSKWNDAKAQCGTGCLPGSQAYATRDDASTAATVATITIVGGAVLAAAGLTLFIVAPRSAKRVGVTPGLGSLSLTGTF